MDGSLTGQNAKTGVGIHCKVFSHYLSVDKNKTSVDGKIKTS